MRTSTAATLHSHMLYHASQYHGQLANCASYLDRVSENLDPEREAKTHILVVPLDPDGAVHACAEQARRRSNDDQRAECPPYEWMGQDIEDSDEEEDLDGEGDHAGGDGLDGLREGALQDEVEVRGRQRAVVEEVVHREAHVALRRGARSREGQLARSDGGLVRTVSCLSQGQTTCL